MNRLILALIMAALSTTAGAQSDPPYVSTTPVCDMAPPTTPCRFEEASRLFTEVGNPSQGGQERVSEFGEADYRRRHLQRWLPWLSRSLPGLLVTHDGARFVQTEIWALTSGSPGFSSLFDPAISQNKELVISARNQFCLYELLDRDYHFASRPKDVLALFHLATIMEQPSETPLSEKETEVLVNVIVDHMIQAQDGLLKYMDRHRGTAATYCFMVRYFDSLSALLPLLETSDPVNPRRMEPARKVLEQALVVAFEHASEIRKSTSGGWGLARYSDPELARLIWTDLSVMCHRLDNVLERCRNDLMPALSDQLVWE